MTRPGDNNEQVKEQVKRAGSAKQVNWHASSNKDITVETESREATASEPQGSLPSTRQKQVVKPAMPPVAAVTANMFENYSARTMYLNDIFDKNTIQA